MSPAAERELCFAIVQDTFVLMFLPRDNVVSPVPPTRLEEGVVDQQKRRVVRWWWIWGTAKHSIPRICNKPLSFHLSKALWDSGRTGEMWKFLSFPRWRILGTVSVSWILGHFVTCFFFNPALYFITFMIKHSISHTYSPPSSSPRYCTTRIQYSREHLLLKTEARSLDRPKPRAEPHLQN